MNEYIKKSLITAAILAVSGVLLLITSHYFGEATQAAPTVAHGATTLEVVNGVPAIGFTIAGVVAILIAIGFVAQAPFNMDRTRW